MEFKGEKKGNYLRLTLGLVGLGVTCSPRDPRFVGSNLAEVDGFLGRKNSEHKSSERNFKLGVLNLRFQSC